MPFFRMRLILALIAGITLVSVGSTYFDVLAHKHVLAARTGAPQRMAGRKPGAGAGAGHCRRRDVDPINRR